MIKRFTPEEPTAQMTEWKTGNYVLLKDHLCVVEELEYDLRYYREEVDNKEETIQDLIEEVIHWKDLYNELYEQTS